MKLKNLLLILSIFALITSCSSNKKVKDESPIDEVAVAEEDADFIVDSNDEELIVEDEKQEKKEEEAFETFAEEQKEEPQPIAQAEETPMEEVATAAPVVGELQDYLVQKGDTLMYIAFKKLGDYRKWRELSKLNGGIVSVTPGTTIKYEASAFAWAPKGNPYLIKRGDTLGTISNDKYGTSKRWKDLWNNNKPMIKDPNLIFAGFTLYYIPDRELASEM